MPGGGGLFGRFVFDFGVCCSLLLCGFVLWCVVCVRFLLLLLLLVDDIVIMFCDEINDIFFFLLFVRVYILKKKKQNVS